MAVGGALVWREGSDRYDGRISTTLFGIQIVLISLWTAFFFRLRSPSAAIVEIGLLLIAVLTWYVSASRIDRRTRWLILPYITWVTFAMILNGSIRWMNCS